MEPLSHPKRIRVLVAEATLLGSEVVSEALKRRGNAFSVQAVAGDSAQTLHAIHKYEPEVVVISAGLSDGPATGLNVLQEMRAAKRKTAGILLMDSDDKNLTLMAFRTGARGISVVKLHSRPCPSASAVFTKDKSGPLPFN